MSRITFLGTGTSQGVPVISCGCRVCMSPDSMDKRLRSSVMIETGGRNIVIDAGPDFRQQMLRENVKKIDGILLTHEHKDHTGGLDDVRAFNYTSRAPVDIYATKQVQKTILKDFDYAFGEHTYPGVPQMNLVTINPDEPFRVKDIEVIPIKGLHYKMPVLGFRIGDLAYVTDFNRIDQSEIDKIKGVDVLVINALRHEQHLSHFTLSEAIQISSIVGPQQTYLTHISHEMGLSAEVSMELPQGVHLSYDGLVVEINDK